MVTCERTCISVKLLLIQEHGLQWRKESGLLLMLLLLLLMMMTTMPSIEYQPQ